MTSNPNPVPVNLPRNKTMYITIFGSSENVEQVILTAPDGTENPFYMGTSSGGNDVLMHAKITTTAASGSETPLAYTLSIQNTPDIIQDPFVYSQVTHSHEYSFNTYNLRVVTAGDVSDDTYSDCVVHISWFTEQD